MNQLPEDDMLRQFWLESKKEAPMGFSDAIMQNLPQYQPLPEALTKPLLSLKATGFLAGFVVALALLLNYLPGSSTSAAPTLYQPLTNMLGWLGANIPASVVPSLTALCVAIMLLIGLDRLLKHWLQRTSQAG